MPSPTNRVLALLELLQNADEIPGTELARQLEVDRRTLRRYITRLQDMGCRCSRCAGGMALTG
jgi:predicted DNA-binding transcriptional regulator YafY